jgi:hypothetical protein
MTLVHYFGVLVRTPAGWVVLDDAGHTPSGLDSVTVHTSGRLILTYPTVSEVGTFSVTADETWCGKYAPGASVGFSRAVITVRDPMGALVHADALVGAGNFWVDFWAWS